MHNCLHPGFASAVADTPVYLLTPSKACPSADTYHLLQYPESRTRPHLWQPASTASHTSYSSTTTPPSKIQCGQESCSNCAAHCRAYSGIACFNLPAHSLRISCPARLFTPQHALLPHSAHPIILPMLSNRVMSSRKCKCEHVMCWWCLCQGSTEQLVMGPRLSAAGILA